MPLCEAQVQQPGMTSERQWAKGIHSKWASNQDFKICEWAWLKKEGGGEKDEKGERDRETETARDRENSHQKETLSNNICNEIVGLIVLKGEDNFH